MFKFKKTNIFSLFDFISHSFNCHWLFYDLKIVRNFQFNRVNWFNENRSRFIHLYLIKQEIKNFNFLWFYLTNLRVLRLLWLNNGFLLDDLLFGLLTSMNIFGFSLRSWLLRIWVLWGEIFLIWSLGLIFEILLCLRDMSVFESGFSEWKWAAFGEKWGKEELLLLSEINRELFHVRFQL